MTNTWQDDATIPEPLRGKKPKRGRKATQAAGHHLAVLNEGFASAKKKDLSPGGAAGKVVDSHGMPIAAALFATDIAWPTGLLTSAAGSGAGNLLGLLAWTASGAVLWIVGRKAYVVGKDKVPHLTEADAERLDLKDGDQVTETVMTLSRPSESASASSASDDATGSTPARAGAVETAAVTAELNVDAKPVELEVEDAVRTPGTDVFGDMSAVSPVFTDEELRERIKSEQEDITQMFQTADILAKPSKKNPEGQSVVLLKPKIHDDVSWRAYLWLPEGVGVGTVRARLGALATSQLDTIPQKIFVQQIPGADSERKIILRVFKKLPFTGDPVPHPLLNANQAEEA